MSDVVWNRTVQREWSDIESHPPADGLEARHRILPPLV
jgi:hypothetical protein